MKNLIYLLAAALLVSCNQGKANKSSQPDDSTKINAANVAKTDSIYSENWGTFRLKDVSQQYAELITLEEYRLNKVNDLFKKVCNSEINNLNKSQYYLGGDEFFNMAINATKNSLPGKVESEFTDALSYLYFKTFDSEDSEEPAAEEPTSKYAQMLIADYETYRNNTLPMIKIVDSKIIQDTEETLSFSIVNEVDNSKYVVIYSGEGYPTLSKVK